MAHMLPIRQRGRSGLPLRLSTRSISQERGKGLPPGRRPPPADSGKAGPGDGHRSPARGEQIPRAQVPLGGDSGYEAILNAWGESTTPPDQGGYLHVYRATRPLHLLYIDGMGAGKTNMGTLDTQDLVLRRLNASRPMDERQRAADLCRIAGSWGLDGVIRMEAGFEIIKCDFSVGLELVTARRRPGSGDSGNVNGGGVLLLEYMRAVSQRYSGIGRDRARIDWGSMVSAWWYPVDLTNPNESGEAAGLPRLVNVSDEELDAMKARIREKIAARLAGGQRRPGTQIDWQGVVDMIVARYADRIKVS